MAVRRNSGRIGSKGTLRRLFERVSRYDLVLAVLPLGLFAPALAHLVAAVALQPALAVGALFGLAVTVDALFVHPPGRPPRSPR